MFLIFWLSCTLPTHRETLELISLLDNGHVFETRFTKGDTGIYKGQGHLHLNRWTKTGTPVSFHFDSPPVVSEFKKDDIDFFGFRMYKEEDIWQLYIRSEEYNVSGQIRPNEEPSLSLKEEDWTIDILHPHAQLLGWSSTFGRSGMLKGDTVILHRYGTALLEEERTLIIAFDSTNHVGIEYSNLASQSWGKWNTTSMRDEDITQEMHAHHIDISIQNEKLQFYIEAVMGEEDLYKHLSTAERLLSSQHLLTAPRTVLQGKLQREDGKILPGVCFYQGDEPPTPSPKRQ